MNSLLVQFPICGCGCTYLSLPLKQRRWQNGIALVGAMNTSAIITLGGVQITALGECAWVAIIMRHMMVVVAPAAQARARPGIRV
jgi:hypothetical protein